MEKENKEITENIEQKEDDSVKSNGKDRKKDRKWFTRIKAYIKKHPYRIPVVILLCIALFFALRETGVISKHVYKEVENLGEREGVCYDNLLLFCTAYLYDIRNGEVEARELCVFNSGDIYCFESPDVNMWNYDDANWERLQNVLYLGCLSNSEVERLNKYAENYNTVNDNYYIRDGSIMLDEYQIVRDERRGLYVWSEYSVTMFLNDQNQRRNISIISCRMNYYGNGRYVKGEIFMKSNEENAIAALELFESSGFYDRWVAMCLNNE